VTGIKNVKNVFTSMEYSSVGNTSPGSC